ncbi:MAG: helix-turn-helix transcriptional regulator [Gammaproteobacteria bacterium]
MSPRTENTESSAAQDELLNEPPQLMGAACDFISGVYGETEWLNALKGYVGCDSILGGWWYINDPETYRTVSSDGPEIEVPVDWIRRLDTLLDSKQDLQTSLIEAPASGETPYLDNAGMPVFSDDRHLAFIGFGSVRAVMIFSVADNHQLVRLRLQNILPQIEKMLAMKDRVNIFQDMLNLANAVFSLIPRGVVTILPNTKIVKANDRAIDLMKDSSLVYKKDDEFHFQESDLQCEFVEQLDIIDKLPPQMRIEYAWYKQLVNYEQTKSLLLTMRALSFDRGGPNVGPYKWAVVITLGDKEVNLTPGEAKLREFYQMSRAEAAFVNEFLRTTSIEDAAKARGITVHTARSHLRSVYEKVGVGDKAQLVRALSSSLILHNREAGE